VTTYKPARAVTYRYDFRWRGRRYEGSTGQLTPADAALVEADIKKRVRQQEWGIAPFDRTRTPTFTEWAGHALVHQRTRLTRPDLYERTLRMVLGFFGTTPTKGEPVEDAPYHDLRLADPILDAEWLGRFEDWMTSRGLSGSTKNSYRSALSGLYRLAMRPAWRKKTHVTSNPCVGIERDAGRSRTTTISVAQLRAWMEAAPVHVKLALAIAALAPKLRLASILRLRWDKHVTSDLTYITNDQHKTIRTTDQPQVIPIDPQLRAILLPFKQAAKRARKPYVVLFRDQPVSSIRKALATAAGAAGLEYGMAGVTFHTMRHSMATLLAELGVPEKQRQAVMGHLDLSTTQKYTHLRPDHEKAPLAVLSAAVPIQDLVPETVPGRPSKTRRKGQRSKAKKKRGAEQGNER
jgi:integrase